MKKETLKNGRTLELSRETIRSLSPDENRQVRGGLCMESVSFCEDTLWCNTYDHC